MLSKAEARKIMLAVKGTSEAPYFGKHSVFYGESFVGRVHDKEEAVALRVGTIEMRDVMLEAEPELFYITDHYKNWPGLLARLSVLDKKTLKALIAGRAAQLAEKPAKKRRKPAKKAKKLTRR
jgi:hypothetical protein